MPRIVEDVWSRSEGHPFERASALERGSSSEGIDIERIRFDGDGAMRLDADRAHLVSPTRGSAILRIDGERDVAIELGVHVLVPRGCVARLMATAGCAFVHAAGDGDATALRVRDERFLRACATPEQSLRWILTPQYLSRRIFLYHDDALLSKTRQPVSWFHTTMFDVAGLPPNEDGEPVFKMSYNSRTEINVCYDVTGDARVRMAHHPYAESAQAWRPWERLDATRTYHLNEAAGGPEEERIGARTFRNKHEIAVHGGAVTLFCLFDPAPTGIEQHQPGAYSDYEPIERVMARAEYVAHKASIHRFDEMVDTLSLARARGELDRHRRGALWALYEEGLASQRALERRLLEAHPDREAALAPWLAPPPPLNRPFNPPRS